MTMIDYMNRKLTDYYDTMFMDGFMPHEILAAAHQTMRRNYLDAIEPTDKKITVETRMQK